MLRANDMRWIFNWLVFLWVGSALLLMLLFTWWTRGHSPSRRMTAPVRSHTFFRRKPPEPRPSH